VSVRIPLDRESSMIRPGGGRPRAAAAPRAAATPATRDSAAGPAPEEASELALEARPTTPLGLASLIQISVYWFALNAIWGGFELFQQERTLQLLGREGLLAVGIMDVAAAPIAVLTMPVMGSISDHVASRWGRRRPFILIGSLLASLSLAGLALAPTFALLLTFFLLLQFTTNIARGPFAGLVPDLVPAKQVGLASGLMGLMIVAGLVGGYLIIWTGYFLGPDPRTPDFTLPVMALAAIVGLAGVGTFLWTPPGPAPKPRNGRSWVRIGLETFGPDILRHRSYVWVLISRFFMLMAGGFFMNLNVFFLANAFGMDAEERSGWVLLGLAVTAILSAVGTLPGARLSDRVRRKPVIYGAAAIGAGGMALLSFAHDPWLVILGIGVVGLASGAFLAVDWALMTDIIPKASAGRYMGMTNIVEATNGPLAAAFGSMAMYTLGLALGEALGARLGMSLGVIAFALGGLLLLPVREPQRDSRPRPADAEGADLEEATVRRRWTRPGWLRR
jgi:MFS family permease